MVEVDVSPVETQELSLAEATENGRGKERSEAGWRRFEEATDFLGVEDRPFLPRDAWSFASIELADRVGLDQASTHCVRKEPRQRGQRHGDRCTGVAMLPQIADQGQNDRRTWRRGRPKPYCGLASPRPLQRDRRGLVSETDRTPEQTTAAETVETLVWLLETPGVDRRRYRIVSRLRSVRDSDEFATLPEDLRESVRKIVAESER